MPKPMTLTTYRKSLLYRGDCVLLACIPVNRAMTRDSCSSSQLRAGLACANYPLVKLNVEDTSRRAHQCLA